MKIRKHIAVLLSILILVSNIGIALSVHYCGNAIASVSFKTNNFYNDTEDDCCGEVAEKSSCCKDEVVKFEKKGNIFITKSYNFHSDFSFLIQEYKIPVFSNKPNFKKHKQTFYICNSNGPPIFKRNCQLIFYA